MSDDEQLVNSKDSMPLRFSEALDSVPLEGLAFLPLNEIQKMESLHINVCDKANDRMGGPHSLNVFSACLRVAWHVCVCCRCQSRALSVCITSRVCSATSPPTPLRFISRSDTNCSHHQVGARACSMAQEGGTQATKPSTRHALFCRCCDCWPRRQVFLGR